jgi:hypothetical protein
MKNPIDARIQQLQTLVKEHPTQHNGAIRVQPYQD